MITGNDLKLLRISSKQTQSQLAEKLGNGGYTKQIVYSIEKGDRNIGLAILSDWATACGYDVSISFTKKNSSNVDEIEETSLSDLERMVEESGEDLND